MNENTRQTTPSTTPEPDYIRVLSHQLKAPINSIQALLTTIIQGFTGEIPPQARYVIEKAVNRAAEANEMIVDLLDYEAYTDDAHDPGEELELMDLLQGVINKYASRAAEKNIFLHAAFSGEHRVFMQGKRKGLEHALRNILENAIKYTPEHGQVTIASECLTDESVCQIRIADTGYGIPAEDLPHIFDPFFRSIKHKASISGTGLGLPIAKRVIDNHRGAITVESTEQHGATFTISLPYLRYTPSRAPMTKRTKVVIIGGVTAGPKAAARLRRLDENLDITIIEKGQFLSYAGCGLPAYITNKVQSARALMSTADNTIRDVDFFESIEDITVLNNTLAVGIDREKRQVIARNLRNQTILEVPYDILILATGTHFLKPNLPGIDLPGIYSLHSLEEAESLKHAFAQKEAQDVYIIGGGLIGTSIAEALIQPGARVTIMEREAHIMSHLLDRDVALKIQHELSKKGIKILTSVQIEKIEQAHDRLAIFWHDDAYYADLIILATGVMPNNVLAREAGLEIGPSGGIRVTPTLQTSDEHIYAVGDCAESVNLITQQHEYWPLGSVSTKMGRIAADAICGRPATFQGSIGTVMFKILNLNVARTGLTLQRAAESGFAPEAVIVAGLDRAHYAENANDVILKVIADQQTQRLLGAQGYGPGDVIAKIQMLACAITQELTLEDIFTLDLGYAPAFNMPIDIVQTACLVLKNKIEGLLHTITPEEFDREKNRLDGIVDVSPFSEHALHTIPDSVNIPLENLRQEGIPFDKEANVVLYSHTSSGAYKAYRYLSSIGYTRLRVIEGGYVCWKK